MIELELDEFWLKEENKQYKESTEDEWLADPSLRVEERNPSMISGIRT